MLERDARVAHGWRCQAVPQGQDGYAGREAAEGMIGDAQEFIEACLTMGVVLHVAQNTSGRRSAVPDAIAQTDACAVSQQKTKLYRAGL